MDTAGFFAQLAQQLLLSAPLFLLIALGYGLGRFAGWPDSVNEGLNRFCFNVAIPCMLFNVMSKFWQSPPVDMRLLIAYFGSCFVLYILGRLLAKVFRLDAISASVFGMAGIFSNNVMLGIPVALILLGPTSLASVALVLVFNSLILWTLVTVSIEWAQNGSFSVRGIAKTLTSVLRNPIIIGIFSGFLWSLLLQRPLPQFIASPVNMVAQIAAPLTLITLGMSLSHYQIRKGLPASLTICLLKLVLMPALIWLAAWLLHLPREESQVVVLLGSMAVGINVYLMAQKFQVLQGATATSMLLSTLFSTVSTPLFMILMGQFYPDW